MRLKWTASGKKASRKLIFLRYFSPQSTLKSDSGARENQILDPERKNFKNAQIFQQKIKIICVLNFRSLISKLYGRHSWPRTCPNVFAPPATWRIKPWKGLLIKCSQNIFQKHFRTQSRINCSIKPSDVFMLYVYITYIPPFALVFRWNATPWYCISFLADISNSPISWF